MAEQGFYKAILVFCILFLLVLALAPGCSPVKTVEVKDTITNFEYERLVIEGMPCILWDKYHAATSSMRGGLTCNWNKWDSNLSTWLGE